MITLITGLPGNGKTLYTLQYVLALSKKEKRQVYYDGITINDGVPNNPFCDWHKLEGSWVGLPPLSIVIIDEAQKRYRPRGQGVAPPEEVQAMEVHRHSGIDLFMITQHPMLMDSSVRRLVNQHFHLVRKFGMQASVVHEWTFCKDQCDKSRSDSVRHDWSFPKNLYPFYHSAEVHTHKRRLPMSYYVVGVSVLCLLPVLWFSGKWFFDTATGKKAGIYSVAAPGALVSKDGLKYGGASSVRPVLTVADYMRSHTALIQAIPSTAPVYQELAKPTVVPRVAGCVASKSKCICYTQQATRIFMADAACRMLADSPAFRDFQGTEIVDVGQVAGKELQNGSMASLEGPPTDLQSSEAVGVARPLATGIKPHPVVIPQPYR